MAALTIDFNRILYRVHVVCVVHGGFEKKNTFNAAQKCSLAAIHTEWQRLMPIDFNY